MIHMGCVYTTSSQTTDILLQNYRKRNGEVHRENVRKVLGSRVDVTLLAWEFLDTIVSYLVALQFFTWRRSFALFAPF